MKTEEVWKHFHDQLLGFILKRVKDEEIAHDLLQEVFIKIHTKVDTLQSRENLSGWIYTITKNVITDYYRSAAKAETSNSIDIPLADKSSETEPEPEYCEECLKPFVQKLPTQYKDAILATDLGPYSQKEYAKEIGISYSGLKSRVQRGRRQLFELFSNCCKERSALDDSCEKTMPCGCPA